MSEGDYANKQLFCTETGRAYSEREGPVLPDAPTEVRTGSEKPEKNQKAFA